MKCKSVLYTQGEQRSCFKKYASHEGDFDDDNYESIKEKETAVLTFPHL